MKIFNYYWFVGIILVILSIIMFHFFNDNQTGFFTLIIGSVDIVLGELEYIADRLEKKGMI